MDNPLDFARKYTEDLLSFFGLNVDVEVSEDDEVIHVSVPSTEYNGFLIGSNAETMRSLQAVVGAALRSKGFAKNRVNLDVADYKKQRADRLRQRAGKWIDKVKASGQDMPLEPMNAADRRVIHQLAAEHSLATKSAGEGHGRHIILSTIKEK